MAENTAITKKDAVGQIILKVEERIKGVLPRGVQIEHFSRVLASAIQKDPKLMQCNPTSIILAAIQAAELGLEPNGILGYSYLVPYKGNAQLQIGYRGFIELARRSNAINYIVAEVVYMNDKFSRTLGVDRNIVHEPYEGERGDARGAYAVVFYKNGTKDFEYMTEAEIQRCKKSSRSAESEYSPWHNWPDEMRRKTAIRRLMKRVPLSPEDRAIQDAAAIDEQNDLAQPIVAGEITREAEVLETYDFPASDAQPATQIAEEHGTGLDGDTHEDVQSQIWEK